MPTTTCAEAGAGALKKAATRAANAMDFQWDIVFLLAVMPEFEMRAVR
jgi:hypothetical protein